MTAQSTARRRQLSLEKAQKHVATTAPMTPRVINAAPSLEKAEMYGIDDNRPAYSRAMALMGRIFIETIPQWLAVGAMLSLIFGGVCVRCLPIAQLKSVRETLELTLVDGLSAAATSSPLRQSSRSSQPAAPS